VRIRTIKPEFWASLTVTELPVNVRLTFIGLWNYVDDEGRGVYDAKLIKSALWPRDDKVSAAKVRGFIEQMIVSGLVMAYEVHGRSYLSVNGWREHQSISKPKPSKFPEPPETSPGRVPDESSREGNREQGTGNREGNRIALSERDELFEAVAEVCGIDWHDLTDSARGPLNKAVAQLRGAHAEPTEVRRRARNWPALFDPDTTLTPSALAKHWPALTNARSAPGKSSKLLALADRLESQ
jgi:hypothetical protein